MQSSNTPGKLALPFAGLASSTYKRAIPTPSQPAGAASLTDGFPPPTFVPVSLGGTPVDGRDMNGILNYITTFQQFQQAGYYPKYDATFSALVGGYPKDCILASADGKGWWRSLVENNPTNPDTAGANWVAHGIRTVFGRTGPAITAQAGDYTAAQVGAVALTDFTGTQFIGINGYQQFPGGLFMQWGTTASIAEDTEIDVAFPTPFPISCFNVQATCNYGGHTDSDVIAQVTNITSSGFRLMRDSGGGSGYVGVNYWFAIGH